MQASKGQVTYSNGKKTSNIWWDEVELQRPRQNPGRGIWQEEHRTH